MATLGYRAANGTFTCPLYQITFANVPIYRDTSTNLLKCQSAVAILPICHCHFAILSFCHFAFAILPICHFHFAILLFCHCPFFQVATSRYHFAILPASSAIAILPFSVSSCHYAILPWGRCQNTFLLRDGSPQFLGPPRGGVPPVYREVGMLSRFSGGWALVAGIGMLESQIKINGDRSKGGGEGGVLEGEALAKWFALTT
jgi:hypothetical protein